MTGWSSQIIRPFLEHEFLKLLSPALQEFKFTRSALFPEAGS